MRQSPLPKTAARPAGLPDIADALGKLALGHRRATAGLIVRTLSVAFLIALLSVQLPAVRKALPIANAIGIALIVWPYFTSTGRLYGWRIALGRRCVEANHWAEAERTLLPLTGVRSALFDAAGEGRYHLALALQSLGKTDEARHLYTEVATQHARTEWGVRAAERLK